MANLANDHLHIATNPRISSLRRMLFINILILVFVCGFGLLEINNIYPDRTFFAGWKLLIVGLLVLLYSLRRYAQLRFLKRIEHRRNAAANEEKHWLATSQPTFKQSAFTVPLILSMRLKLMHICFWLGLVCVGLFPEMSNPVSISAQGFQTLNYFNLVIDSIILSIIIVVGIALLATRYTVMATDSRLNSPDGKIIDWQDFRLFTYYKIPGLLGRKEVVTYELAGPYQVVSWNFLLDPQSPFTVWKPILLPEEYQRQMQTLCELVVAKTGLQLYDLSQPEEGD